MAATTTSAKDAKNTVVTISGDGRSGVVQRLAEPVPQARADWDAFTQGGHGGPQRGRQGAGRHHGA